MIRRKRVTSSSTVTTYPNDPLSSSEREKRDMMMRSTASDPQLNNHHHHHNGDAANTPKPIIPHWVVCLIVVFFVAAGFTQNYWKKSRFEALSHSHNHHHHHPHSHHGGGSTNTKRIHSLLTPAQDEELERDSHTGLRYHLVFSTDCSPYQHWQSYLVFFTAMKVQQPGHVTRIASGCGEEEAAAMQEWFDRDVQPLSKRFHLQLTPHFSDIKDEEGNSIGDYKFFNKPFGLKYWMENSPQLNYQQNNGGFDKSLQNDVVILIDPDMGILRKITADFSDDRESLIATPRQSHVLSRKVEPGKPFAQVYGFGTQWQRLDLEKIAGPNTPAAKVSQEDGRLYYPVGPPYLATVPDMHRIAVSWSAFVPATYAQYPHLLAEMFAFCIAAAHEELPHQLMDSLMISAVNAGGEGWPLVDAIPAEEVCAFAKNIDHSKYAVPSVVHLCQRYMMGDEWFFSKRKVPADIYDCDVPLFSEPPDDLAVKYDFKQAPGGGKRQELSPKEAVREAFMLCYLHSVVNEAAAFYKQHACEDEREINLEKTRSLVQLFEEQKKS